MTRFLDALADRIDRAIGAAELKPSLRMQLLTEQIRALVQMTPAMTVGSGFIGLLLLFLAADTQRFPHMLVWAAALCATLVVGSRTWWRSRRSSEKRQSSARGLRRAVVNAFFLGALWGIVPVMLMPLDDAALRMTTGVAIAGLLCSTALAFGVLPMVAVAFTLPVVAGSALSLTALGSASEAAALASLIVCFAFVMPFISVRMAQNFVQRFMSETRIVEQKDIISLLLKEFEENSSDWLWEFDREGRIDRASDRFVSAAGRPRDDLIGQPFLPFLQSLGGMNEPSLAEIEYDIGHLATFRDVVIAFSVGGEERWWRITGKPAYDEAGEYLGYIGTASDVTAEKLAERKINYLAHNDALTGLLNRGRFTDHLKASVARLERYGSPFAVLFLDLDQFKSVNDSRGHLVGDRLLTQVSARIRTTLREADLAARLGGDEFAIIVSNHCDVEDISALASRLVGEVNKPYDIEGEVISVGVSIGIALAPLNGTRPDQLQRNADLALYRAKAEGRGVFRFFESQMDSDVRERRILELELREALTEQEFVLHYQPLVSAEDGRTTGFEALVRWNHPIRGLVPPAEFIPIAEQSGLINEIGDWTIREACLAAARWPEELVVAVNLSARHFQTSDIAKAVSEALEASKLPPWRLELEITESLLIEELDEAIAKLADLKQLGVTIAMDDFGTGYSSLSYLLKFPFDKIKIDKSFVTASSEDAVARDILRSIASLGKTLKIRITAEGVETAEQVVFLRDIACHSLQGFFFSRPLDPLEMSAYFLNSFSRRNGLPHVGTDGMATALPRTLGDAAAG